MTDSQAVARSFPWARIPAEMWARRGAVAAFVAGVAAAAVVVALVLPPWYTAESRLLPPPEGGADAFGTLSGLIESSALSRIGLATTSTPSDVFAEILRSRTLCDSTVTRFGLARLYHVKGAERAIKEFRHHVGIAVTPSGIITLRVEDHDPRRAAAMANYLVDRLDQFNRETYNTRAKRTRQFLEARLNEIQTRMHEAETHLSDYEREHHVVATEGNADVSEMAKIMAQKMNLQIRRSYVSSYTTPGSSLLREIDADLDAVEQQLAKLPTLKLEGARLELDAEIQRRLFTLVSAQFEDARLQEMRDTPTVTVMDRAVVPEMRSRPRRILIVGVSTTAAVLLAAAWVALAVRRSAA